MFGVAGSNIQYQLEISRIQEAAKIGQIFFYMTLIDVHEKSGTLVPPSLGTKI